MYQVEDLIRAFNLDMTLIEDRLVTNYKTDEKTSIEITDWYQNLVSMMEKERIQEKGHLQFLTNLTADVNEFHLKLIETRKDAVYVQNFQSISGLVKELKAKNTSAKNDIDLAIAAIYGFLLLKMQKKSISDETTNAIKMISQWFSGLAKLYKEFEEGKFEI